MTVEAFRDQSRRRRLAYATRAGKQIGMMQAIVLERILERARQDFLSRHIFKFLWTPLAGDYLIGH